MFEPRVFKKNGLEAFRLVGSDGSEFFYEGVIDCNENEIYRDDQGRLYYPVVTEMGGAVKYYVELAMDFPPIPSDPGDMEKEISRLVNVSPRGGRQLPEDVFVPQAEEAAPVEAPATEEPAAQALPEPEPVKEPAAPEVVVKPTEPTNAQEPLQEAEPPARKPKKSRSMAVPIAIGLIVVVLIAAVVGVYVLKPGAFQGLASLYGHPAPTPTPEPTPLPTDVPVVTATPEPTPNPTPEPQNITTETLLQIQPLIDVGNGSMAGFTAEHVAANSAGNPIRQAYDLYTFVNGRWNDTGDESTEGLPASALTGTLQGNSRDYSVLMCALTNETGVESRVIAYYKDDQLYYYPEILVANNSSGYASAKADLKAWFGVTQPFGHNDDAGYWISMSRGTAPGTRVEASEEFAVYFSGAPVKIK
ncbi:transglutaminase domain-containing protein [Methanocella sp. MCL-LM]|uniref:transglutaminase domain-containing protein n=1 Tax=Methanocella sp. MCL-LM TaxID=3412035 RepID=UPI003C76EF1C